MGLDSSLEGLREFVLAWPAFPLYRLAVSEYLESSFINFYRFRSLSSSSIGFERLASIYLESRAFSDFSSLIKAVFLTISSSLATRREVFWSNVCSASLKAFLSLSISSFISSMRKLYWF